MQEESRKQSKFGSHAKTEEEKIFALAVKGSRPRARKIQQELSPVQEARRRKISAKLTASLIINLGTTPPSVQTKRRDPRRIMWQHQQKWSSLLSLRGSFHS